VPRCCHRASFVAIAVLMAAPACAQVSGSATLVSDYRYRGGSLSGQSPTASVAWAWDADDGWYAGTQFTRVRFGADAPWELQATPYLGLVRVLDGGRTVEAGAQYTWYGRSTRYATSEFYVGLNGEHLQGRLSWTPAYFGGASSWYAGIDGSRPLHGRLRAFAHVGLLHPVGASAYVRRHQRRWQTDITAGLGYARAGFDLQARWTGASARAPADADADADESCVPWQCGSRSQWVLLLTRTW
jgi:uncharacterized protein (TIGR02001 family)